MDDSIPSLQQHKWNSDEAESILKLTLALVRGMALDLESQLHNLMRTVKVERDEFDNLGVHGGIRRASTSHSASDTTIWSGKFIGPRAAAGTIVNMMDDAKAIEFNVFQRRVTNASLFTLLHGQAKDLEHELRRLKDGEPTPSASNTATAATSNASSSKRKRKEYEVKEEEVGLIDLDVGAAK